LVVYPHAYQVSATASPMGRERMGMAQGLFASTRPFTILESFGAARGVPVINLLALFRAREPVQGPLFRARDFDRTAAGGAVFAPFPVYVAKADGACKWDVDGHRYIDGWSGHGAMILGHNHPAVLKAILEQAPKGTHYSAGSEIELRWAELIREIVPGAERVRFTMTGTETTALAIRIA